LILLVYKNFQYSQMFHHCWFYFRINLLGINPKHHSNGTATHHSDRVPSPYCNVSVTVSRQIT